MAKPMSVRVSALKALGTIPGSSSQAALSHAAKSGEGQIRKTALRALQEAQQVGLGSQQ